MTFGTCVHAHRELACGTNISTVHEWILFKFYILLSDNNDNSKITLQLINNGNKNNKYINSTNNNISRDNLWHVCVRT